MEKNIIIPKVSVCISVHNTARYLPRCLDSVCAQTLQSLEIVLVNNGSSDNSLDIMYDYEARYPERIFHIIDQEDRSLAGGRQTGINNSTGKYITFLDADDYVKLDAYEKMFNCAEQEQVDIVEMETTRDGKDMGSVLSGVHKTHDVLRKYFTTGGIHSMLWLRMYKRKLFTNFVFPSIYTNNEDMFAMPCIFHVAKNIYFLKESLHTYSTDNENGIMQSETYNSKLSERRFQSRKTALLSIPYFQNFVGVKDYEEYYIEHNQYKAKYILDFLLVNFGNKSMKDKIHAIVETLEFTSTKDMNRYLHFWLPKGKLNTYMVYRLFGINVAYFFKQLIKK